MFREIRKKRNKVDALRVCDKVCFTVYGNETIREEAWAPFMQSTVVFGRCHLMENGSEKAMEMLKRFAMKYYPNEQLADEEIAQAGRAVQMFEIEIEHLSGEHAEAKVGNCLPLSLIPVGAQVHNIELFPGKGGQMVRSAGNAAQLMAKEGKYATLRLPSGEMRMVPIECRATIGVVGNGDHNLVKIGKAGRKRHMGIRPTVRGSVMNPNDHPHGGGEGKTGIGRPGPCTPWGKPALGLKTRKKNKQSNKLIVRRRNGKAIS